MKTLDKYDIIVVGAGHAGCEAAAAAARMGSRTLLITMDMTKMAQMSCNPAMGGIAKGQIIREIDALGGLSGKITDKSTIQFRMLNRSKGPAMWSPRAQCDRMVFSTEWRKELEGIENLEFFQDLVVKLLIRENKIFGVETRTGIKIHAKAVILTNGTFLNGLMHVGKSKQKGGRSGEQFAYGISEQLEKLGIEKGRMKTGTPARLDGRSIDFDKMLEQKGERRSSINCFSFSQLKKSKQLKERSCYITYTNESVHELLKEGFDESPLFTGRIEGIGPRYCPSIEDKIVTFSDKDSHHLFLEPEGESTIEWYVNGFSSSLPWNIQLKALRRVKGLEKVKFFRPGYAIEYDYFLPTQLKRTLESNTLKNLWLAGQINGTTGYEEAAAQGLISGINAHLCINKKEEFVLRRNEAYIGVLIDDLVSKGVDEPYRMFTSRAEYRILLRQDNADSRLSKQGYKLGLINKSHFKKFIEKENQTSKLVSFINNLSVKPERINILLNEKGSSLVNQSLKAGKILLRPEITIKELAVHIKELKNKIDLIKPRLRAEVLLKAEIEIKYKGYIEREKLMADKLTRLEEVKLKPDFDYNSLKSLSTEARQKLSRIKPATIAQAKRISGVSPADLSVILVKLGR